MTRRTSARELERAIESLDDETDDGTPHSSSQFVHFDGEVEMVEDDDGAATFDVVLTDENGDVVEPGRGPATEPATDGGSDVAADEPDGRDAEPTDPDAAADVAGPTDDETETDEDSDDATDDTDEPIEVSRRTRLRRRQFAGRSGGSGGARYGPGRWRP